MIHRHFLHFCRKSNVFILGLIILFPFKLHASFIESSIGTAVVNDATATYYNPAALTLLKNPQIIALGSVGSFRSRFTGNFIQTQTGFTQFGSAPSQSNYYLPSIYLGMPTQNKINLGFAIISNMFNRGIEENSILRYAQSSNSIQDIDFVPAIGFKLNDAISLGAGLNFSYANFILRPIFGFPSLNIPDSQSRNEANATAIGGDLGLLLKPNAKLLIGLNYRSAMTYHFSGKSVLETTPELISDHYHFTFWTPARIVLSANHALTTKLGLIATVERIQWSIFQKVNINGIATQIGRRLVILNAIVPYHFRDTWLLTLGSQYRINPKWIVRLAGSYVQSPANHHYQIADGDSIIVGLSTAYDISKNIVIDGSYAHAFFQNENIYIRNNRSIIDGVNTGFRDGVSVKLTFNI